MKKKPANKVGAQAPTWWCECGQVERVTTDDVILPLGEAQFRKATCGNCKRGGMRLVGATPEPVKLELSGHDAWPLTEKK